MASIIGALGTLDVPRMRIGIGAPAPRVNLQDWVLGKFPKEQREIWPKIEDIAWDGLLKWLRGGAGEGFTAQIQAEGAQ